MVSPYTTSQTFARPTGRSMTRQSNRTVGRPKNPGGTFDEWTIGFKPNVLATLGTMAVEEETSIPEVVRRAVDAMLNPQKGEVTHSMLEGAPLLDIGTACGPASEMREQASQSFFVSQDVSDEIGFDPINDFFQRARGFSMQGAGILDEDILCWSPLPEGRHPRIGQIALVGIDDGEGNAYSTAKYWHGYKGARPILRDGDGNDFPLPETIARAWPIAVCKGRIGGV